MREGLGGTRTTEEKAEHGMRLKPQTRLKMFYCIYEKLWNISQKIHSLKAWYTLCITCHLHVSFMLRIDRSTVFCQIL